MPSKPSAPAVFDTLKHSLVRHRDSVRQAMAAKHPQTGEWLKQNEVSYQTLRQKSQKLLAGASLAASLLMAGPPDSVVTTPQEIKLKLNRQGFAGHDEIDTAFSQNLKPLIPPVVGHAAVSNEPLISQLISDTFGILAVPQLEGNRLNHTIGYIGYEQHLKRFPGDDISLHDEQLQAGIAPGLGAWGYFVPSRLDLTQDDISKEKYYFAVQTLYLPTWQTEHRRLYPWYKHRKMIAINPENGKAVVGVIADAGPAKFTGKQFGGSPEVMTHLELITGKKKGKILLYFVDDPDNRVPLGPVIGHISQPAPLIN